MDVLERLVTTALDVLPAGLIDLAYEAMALRLHIAAAVVAGVMLVTALSMAVLLQRREQLLEVVADQRVPRREEQPPRIGTQLAGVVGGPLERRAAVLEGGRDREDDGRYADAELGAHDRILRQEHDHRWDLGRCGGWPEHAHRHGAAQAQVGVLR
jgi:hypothetical protein